MGNKVTSLAASELSEIVYVLASFNNFGQSPWRCWYFRISDCKLLSVDPSLDRILDEQGAFELEKQAQQAGVKGFRTGLRSPASVSH